MYPPLICKWKINKEKKDLLTSLFYDIIYWYKYIKDGKYDKGTCTKY